MTHETVIAARMIEEAEKHGTVQEIVLELGELGHVPPEELVACVQRLRPAWKVTWTEQPSEVLCSCGFNGHPKVLDRGHDHFLIECPECGDIPEVLAGTDAKIVRVIVE